MRLSQERVAKPLAFLLIMEANILLESGTRQPRAGWSWGLLAVREGGVLQTHHFPVLDDLVPPVQGFVMPVAVPPR